MLNKKIAILSLIISGISYGNDDFFYEETKNGVALEESVISTTGFETSKRDITNTVTVVTAKEIAENNYQSVADVLKDIPSVNVIGDPKNPIIDMRGQGSKATANVQILVDGIGSNLLDTSHAKTPINTVPIENIEKIEVIPGGGAILYGSGTRGGIINIVTKSGAGFKGGSTGLEFDSFGGKKSDVSYGTIVEDLGININYSKNDYKGFRDGDESDSEYFEGSLKYRLTKNQNIILKYSRYEEDATSPRMLTKDNLKNPESNGLVNKYDKLITNDTKKDEFNAKYEYKINENIILDILGFYQETEIADTNDYGKIMGLSQYKIINEMNFTDKKSGFKPKLKINYGEGNNLILGYDYINNKLKRNSSMEMFSPEKYINDLKKETHSVFVLNKNKIDKFEFTQGIRYEYAHYKTGRQYIKYSSSPINEKINRDTTMENMAYELVGNYLYSDTGNVYVKGEKGFTSPTPSQLVNKINGRYINNNLKSETYMTYEAGFKDNIFGSFVSGAIYLTETKDEIFTENLDKMDFKNHNIGKTRRHGLELNAEQYFGKLTIREGYSLVKTEILKDRNKSIEGNEISDVPNQKLNLGLDYELTSKLKLITDTVYSAGYYTNNDNKNGKVNEYIVTNITLNYNYSESLRVYTGINNIFNEKYYNSINEDEFDPAAERSFNAGFKYSF